MRHPGIPLAGVIGENVQHSKSPLIFSHWFQRYDVSGYYIPMNVANADLNDVLRTLPKLGFKGINVTIPYKETVFNLADIKTDRAKSVGAANTLTFLADGKISADNTDGLGFIANLKQSAPHWNAADSTAFVLGAGGAARGIIAALLAEDTPEIFLSNRTTARAEALQQEFGPKLSVIPWDQVEQNLAHAGTLINTTSLGMVNHPTLEISLDHLPQSCLVTDIVYTPLETDLLATAKAQGNHCVDGLGMLLHQAVPGFEAWFRHRPTVDDDLRKAVLA